jgi:RHS repeat-associated protein
MTTHISSAGRSRSADTGMYYLRGRFLDSGLSRFASRDPAGFQEDGHLYNDAGNDAIDFGDPTGKCDLPGAFAGAAVVERETRVAVSTSSFERDRWLQRL